MSTQRMHNVFQRMARFVNVLHTLCFRKCSGTGPLGAVFQIEAVIYHPIIVFIVNANIRSL